MPKARWSALALLAVLAIGCGGSSSEAGETDAMCGGHGEDPEPCCCFPAPGAAVCDQVQLCPTIEADCEDGTLGAGTCTLDLASDGAVTCALTALGDPSATGSITWTIRESGGARTSAGTLHIGGARAALASVISQGGSDTAQAYVGALPSDFDADACADFDTAGGRFECMLNATALQDSLSCYDQSVQGSSGPG